MITNLKVVESQTSACEGCFFSQGLDCNADKAHLEVCASDDLAIFIDPNAEPVTTFEDCKVITHVSLSSGIVEKNIVTIPFRVEEKKPTPRNPIMARLTKEKRIKQHD